MDIDRIFTRLANKTSIFAGHYVASAMALLAVVIWIVTGPVFHFSDTWQLVMNTVSSVVTFLMVFLIQHTQNRDALATQLKLDELLRAVQDADDEMIDAEEINDAELEELKRLYASLSGQQHDRLLKRLREEAAVIQAGV
ncbi:MAG: low affinity iron permease family protein [Thermomicrobiales bacterium]|nr:low affinity iron permease family protein [Thermomicrobiales bacterium]